MIPMTLASISESDVISDDPMKFCRALNFFKQPSADVLQNRCPSNFGNIHRKTPVLAPLFNTVAGLKA